MDKEKHIASREMPWRHNTMHYWIIKANDRARRQIKKLRFAKGQAV